MHSVKLKKKNYDTVKTLFYNSNDKRTVNYLIKADLNNVRNIPELVDMFNDCMGLEALKKKKIGSIPPKLRLGRGLLMMAASLSG